MSETTEQDRHHIYQAIGVVEGILEINDLRGSLSIGETVYPTTISKKIRLKHQPGVSQHFKVYPNIRNGQLVFKLINITGTVPTLFRLKGCWEIHEDEPRLVIYRNQRLIRNDRFHSIPLPLAWEDAPEPDGQYWELEAELKGDKFNVLNALGPFDPPRKAIIYDPADAPPKVVDQPRVPKAKPAPTAAKTQAQPTAPAAPAIPLTPQEILAMATPAKISLTCKLNQVPAHRELPDKRIEFFLNDGSDRIFTVRVKPKVFKKLTDHGFDNWVAAIGGDLGPSTKTGFELLNPSIQVFEKKPPADAPAPQQNAQATEAKTPAEKPSAPGAKTAAATARVQPKTEAKADAQVPVDKRKSLLQGVKLK